VWKIVKYVNGVKEAKMAKYEVWRVRKRVRKMAKYGVVV
jgi:hypothetical protein